MENTGQHANRHGPILTALADCQVVISRGMGRRIYDDLTAVGIEVFVTELTDAGEAIEQYIKGTPVDRPDLSCNHGGC